MSSVSGVDNHLGNNIPLRQSEQEEQKEKAHLRMSNESWW